MRITKEEIRTAIDVVFGYGCLIQSFDPDLVQIERHEIGSLLKAGAARGADALEMSREVNALIYRRMDETRGSEYEAYYMEAFGLPGVPVFSSS